MAMSKPEKSAPNTTKPVTAPKAEELTKPTASATAPKADEAPKTDEAAKTAEADEEEKTRGKQPQAPICVIWKDSDPKRPIVAALVHPKGGDYQVRGRGLNGTLGTLADDGYPIGAVSSEGPGWVAKRIPSGVEVLGYAKVLGFPLPQS